MKYEEAREVASAQLDCIRDSINNGLAGVV
jgi:hypothetical protein